MAAVSGTFVGGVSTSVRCCGEGVALIVVAVLLQSKVTLVVSPQGVTHWKLKDGDVVPAGDSRVLSQTNGMFAPQLDPLFDVLMSNVHSQPVDKGSSMQEMDDKKPEGSSCHQNIDACDAPYTVSMSSNNAMDQKKGSPTHCNRPEPNELVCISQPANQYDFLEGIAKRSSHRSFPEPEVAMIFKTSDNEDAIDLWEVERRLKILLKEHPGSASVLNQVGNYWRIKGDTYQAIECFRRALSLSPDNSDVLLNLARILFNLKYYDDAIFLTRESLKKKREERDAWLQHYTLGEIHKAIGQYPEAIVHFKKVLELNPSFHAAEVYLRELKSVSSTPANLYTIMIIAVLSVLVLVVLYRLIIAS